MQSQIEGHIINLRIIELYKYVDYRNELNEKLSKLLYLEGLSTETIWEAFKWTITQCRSSDWIEKIDAENKDIWISLKFRAQEELIENMSKKLRI
jgi:hypothetical protein